MWRLWVWPNFSNKYAVAATGFLLFQMSSSQPSESLCLQFPERKRDTISTYRGKIWCYCIRYSFFIILPFLLKVYILKKLTKIGCWGVLCPWHPWLKISLFYGTMCNYCQTLFSCLADLFIYLLICSSPSAPTISLGLWYAGSLDYFGFPSASQLFWQAPLSTCMYLCVWNLCPFFNVLSTLFWLHLLISLARNVSHFLSIFTHKFSSVVATTQWQTWGDHEYQGSRSYLNWWISIAWCQQCAHWVTIPV